ncbi:MAG: hypothetical protein HY777_02200, partial [Betaproteobacteria bacterium]|nr:hypothetical protein [Betaproteobacteria bacterium]
ATPDFYFINPAGIVFGAGASLDVPASFFAGTADLVKFPDGRYHADPNRPSTFSSAAPEAFGFLGATRGAVALDEGASLATQSGRQIGIFAGDIAIVGATVGTSKGGDIRIAAIGRAGLDVPLTGALPEGAGNIAILNGGMVKTTGTGTVDGGNIVLVGGQIEIDSRRSGRPTGVLSQAPPGGGNAGNVSVSAAGNLSVVGDGQIASATYGSGSAGAVVVGANDIRLDGQGTTETGKPVGVLSIAASGSTGNAGNVGVVARGRLSIADGSVIASDTYASGNAGNVRVGAGVIGIERGQAKFTGISSDANESSSGNAGNVDVATAGTLSLVNGGVISSDTYSSGNAGSVKVSAGSILIERGGGRYTGIFSDANYDSSGHAGRVEVATTGGLSVVDGGRIASDTYAAGNAGSVRVNAEEILVDRRGGRFTGISSDANEGSGGHAGGVEVAATGRMTLVNGGAVSSGTYAAGDAGSVRVSAGALTIDGRDAGFTGISSNANKGSSGRAGNVDVRTSDALTLVSGGRISSETSSRGDAGNVKVSAGSIFIDRRDGGFTAISSDANPESTGNAGRVEAVARETVSLVGGGVISSDTYAAGNAGQVRVSAGNIVIERREGRFTGISSDAKYDSTGNAANVEVVAVGSISIIDGGVISSDTYSSGNAGNVRVSAGSITVDRRGGHFSGISSDANPGSTGGAGNVDVFAVESIALLGGGQVSSETFSPGNAGTVRVGTARLVLDGGAVSSDTHASGNAGSVGVSVSGQLSIGNGGAISSYTSDAGKAGSISVAAGTLLLDGGTSSINAAAARGSSGQTGSVNVTAAHALNLSNGAELSIRNDAQVAGAAGLTPTVLAVTSPGIALHDARITAASTGNVSASEIRLDVSGQLVLERGSITTSAHLGNGGSIAVTGRSVITLRDAQITTSVSGIKGNGGDISLGAEALVMDTGFIQANTAADRATGGNVGIGVHMLVPGGSTLFVGGQTPFAFQPGIFGFNVIQAAAPTGVSGTIQIASPVLDIAGSLLGLNTEVIDTGGLGRSPCQTTGGNSLSITGRGGLPPSARSLLRAETASPLSGDKDPPRLSASNWRCS